MGLPAAVAAATEGGVCGAWTASATKARKSRSVAWRSTSTRSLGGGGPGGGPHGGRQGKIP